MKKRLSYVAPAFAASALAFAFACSSSSSTSSPPTGEAGADTSSPTADAALDSDNGPDANSDKIGAIFAISDTTTYRSGAFFARTISPDTTTKTKTVGPCVLETIGDGDTAKEEAASAGVVHIEGGKKAIDLSPKADKSYATITGAESLWNGGETLTITGAGKDVPAFTTTLVAPSKVTLTSPTTTAGDLGIDRSAGFSATFSGASSGVVVLYFDAATSSAAFTATCSFDVAAGAAQVPAAAFADFPAIEGTFNFYVKTDSVAPAGDWYVRFTASSAIVSGAGDELVGRATFQ